MLGYAEYGDAQGLPLLYFHGTPGSRVEVAFADDLCRRAGVRLLAPDRPGLGLSERKPDRTLADWAGDVEELADRLGLERFPILAWSAGGPFALACASRLPHRVTCIGTCGGAPPFHPGQPPGLASDRLLLRMSGRHPRLAALALWVASWMPPSWLRQAFLQELRSRPDRAIWSSLTLQEATDPFYDALRQGPWGVVDEYRILGSPWPFDPARITSQVIMWQGDTDDLIPLRTVRELARSLPGARLVVVPGQGHFLLRTLMEDVVKTLTAGPPALCTREPQARA
jgi:pimeloyl-ACP methyl ester carboxylesterase